MSKKRKGAVAAAAAFAASPQGRRLLQQAKDYAQRPETKAKARELIAQARTRAKAAKAGATSSRPADAATPTSPTSPTYGSPPVR
jgi:hypothetical protein